MKKFFTILLLLFWMNISPDYAFSQDWGDIPQYTFDYQGNWSNTATYNANQAVRGSDGKLYVAVEDNVPVNTNPVGSTRYWAEAVSSQGVPGNPGAKGDSFDTIYLRSSTQPTLPPSPTYSNGTFSAIGTWSNTVPTGDNLWMAIYMVDANNNLSNPQLIYLGGPRGPPGIQGNTGPAGNSVDYVFGRFANPPTLPGDNTGTRVGNRITVAPSGWELTAEATSGTNPLYTAVANLPGGNLTIDYITVVRLSGEQGGRGQQGIQGGIGNTGTSIAIVYQRKSGAAPNLPADNTGTRSGARLSSAPSGWSLTDPGGNDPLYEARAFLTAGSTTAIDWVIVSKMTGEKGDPGNDGNDGNDGVDGYSSRSIYRKVNTYDYTGTPAVTYSGVRPPNNASLNLPDQWSLVPYVSQRFGTWNLPTTTPQDFDYDVDTNLVYTLSSTAVNKNSLSGTAPAANASWNLRSNNTSPRSITILGNQVLVLDDQQRSQDNNFFYRIFVYQKAAGGFDRTITIPTPQTDPRPTKIAAYDGKIYVISDKIRVFQPTGVELTDEALPTLPSEITNVTGFAASNEFIHILDATDNRVYTLDRQDLTRRIVSREFNLSRPGLGAINPLGIALSEFELHIIETSNNSVDRYYNPNNRLWESGLFIDLNSPHAVVSTPSFQAAVRRERPGTGGTTTIIQGGGGGSGAAGADGRGYTFIFREDMTKPAAPTGGSWTQNVFTPPTNWSEQTPNRTANDPEELWASSVILPAGGGTPRYGAVIQLNGDDAPDVMIQYSVDGHGSWGDDNTIVNPYFIRFSTDGGTTWSTAKRFRQDGTAGTPGRPGTNAPNVEIQYSVDNTSYHDSVRNPYYIRFSTDGGTTWSPGERFRQDGTDGEQGIRGVGSEIIFLEAATVPDRPTDGSGTWNYETNSYTPPSGWDLDSTSYSGVQNLYAVKVTLPGSSNTETYSEVWRMNGQRGATGNRGPPGVPGGTTGSGEDGDSLAAIYKRSNTNQDNTIIGVRPTGGTWDHSTNAFTAPSGWENDVPTTTETYIFMAVVTLHGEANSISYDLPVQLTGQRGAAGAAGNPGGTGPTGAQGIPGSSIAYVYAASVGQPTSIRGQTQGLYDRTTNKISNPPSGWHTDPQALTGSQRQWISIADVVYTSQTAYTISYSNPEPLTGDKGQQGERGQAGTGGVGSGTNGDSSVYIYQRATSPPANPSGGTWDHATDTYTAPSGWEKSEQDATGSGLLYGAVVTLSGSTNVVTYTNTIQLEGSQGERGLRGEQGERGPPGASVKGDTGQRGPVGRDGDTPILVFQWGTTEPPDPTPTRWDGTLVHGLSGWHRAPPEGETGQTLWAAVINVNGTRAVYSVKFQAGYLPPDGSSVTLVQIRTNTRPSTPTGATWNGTLFTLPTGYSRGNPPGNDDLWWFTVNLSGTDKTNSGITYEGPIQVTGEDGQPGAPAPQVEIQYSVDNSTYHDSVANPYFIRFSTDGGSTWSTGQRFRQDGTNGLPGAAGTPAPNVQIQYATTLSGTYAANTVNPYFIRFSVDGGTTWSTGQRFRMDGQDGATGVKGDSVKSIYLRKATQPAVPAGITVNANGRFTNLISTQSAPNNDTWHAIPLPGTGTLWKQDIEIDWSSLTVTPLGNPYAADGEKGSGRRRLRKYLESRCISSRSTNNCWNFK